MTKLQLTTNHRMADFLDEDPLLKLTSNERFWRDHQPWLLEHGYALRKRYQPDWVPSWKDKVDPKHASGLFPAEDAATMFGGNVMDATAISDGEFVVLKWSDTKTCPQELTIIRMLSTEPLRSHPRNRCIQLREVLKVPDRDNLVILVMPFLSHVSTPFFRTIGEFIDFCSQAFEGIQFMHQHRISHADCKFDNFLMDSRPLYDSPVHPADPHRTRDWKPIKTHSRTKRPVHYYWIDFDYSHYFPPEVENPTIPCGMGGTKEVPEFKTQTICDPFKLDVFCCGYMILEVIARERLKGLHFLLPFLNKLLTKDPTQRPTIDEVVSHFSDIKNKISRWKLRERLTRYNFELAITQPLNISRHWIRQVAFAIRGLPPVPDAGPIPLRPQVSGKDPTLQTENTQDGNLNGSSQAS